MPDKDRGNFGSRIGFILAAAGSAVGLGNIWRFPYMTGKMGGAIFVLIYLLSVLLIGLPLIIAEVSLGRATGKNPVGAFAAIRPKGPWKALGYLGVFTGIMILSYYSVVAGWTVGYFFKSVTSELSHIDSNTAGAIFGTFTANTVLQIVLTGIFVLLTALIVAGGVSKGIERMSKILMPALFLILILLVIRSVTLPGAGKGLLFYLKPNFSAINFEVIPLALGQALFSLSLGMGAMLTYGSYLDKTQRIPSSSAWVAMLDTSVALLAGFMIFPAIFTIEGMTPTEGPGLVFMILPAIFSKIPLGFIVGPLFFVLLTIAALTSTISLLEVATSYFIDEKKWNRKKATYILSFIAFLFAIPSAVSGRFLGLWDMIWGNISLTIGAFFIVIFVGYVWKTSNAINEINQETGKFRFAALWALVLKYITPVLIIFAFISIFLK